MKEQGKQLPYKKLIDQLEEKEKQSGVEILKDKQGRVIAELSEPSTKNGRRVRRICLYENFDKNQMSDLIKSLSSDFDSSVD